MAVGFVSDNQPIVWPSVYAVPPGPIVSPPATLHTPPIDPKKAVLISTVTPVVVVPVKSTMFALE